MCRFLTAKIPSFFNYITATLRALFAQCDSGNKQFLSLHNVYQKGLTESTTKMYRDRETDLSLKDLQFKMRHVELGTLHIFETKVDFHFPVQSHGDYFFPTPFWLDCEAISAYGLIELNDHHFVKGQENSPECQRFAVHNKSLLSYGRCISLTRGWIYPSLYKVVVDYFSLTLSSLRIQTFFF